MQSICLNGICWGCILKWYIIQGTPKLTQVTYVLSTVCKTATLIWMLEAFANLVVRGFCKELAQSRGGCNAITVRFVAVRAFAKSLLICLCALKVAMQLLPCWLFLAL